LTVTPVNDCPFEIVIGGDVEERQHLIQHVTVLGGDHDATAKLLRPLSQRQHDRRHLDRFRPGPEHAKEGLHAWVEDGGLAADA
jgi:hypothetical protein